ncbi:MAG: hypothetical protein ACRDZ4_14115 [Egibacteraceae bacterium]
MNPLEWYARRGLWALPVSAALLLAGTLTHQPDPNTDFRAYAEYVTTAPLVISHLVTSILGMGIGTLGLVALFVVLASGHTARLALWALATTVIAQALVIAVFGVAAFAQPAVSHTFLAGQAAEAIAINKAIYGPLLFTTALPGVLLLGVGFVLFGVAVARSGSLPAAAGVLFTVAGPLFALIGFAIQPVQTLGAALMTASTLWIAYSGQALETVAQHRSTSSSVLR